jgi:alpha,alpha-trehalase
MIELVSRFILLKIVRESGHDTTYRFEKICAHLATIDLNSLVYKYQSDIASILLQHFDGVIKLHVRKGRDDIYLESFKVWAKLVHEKGVTGSVGNNGSWDSSWAKGIKVYDDHADEDFEKGCHFEEVDLFKMEEGFPGNNFFVVYLHSSLFLQLSKRTREQINTYLWNPEKSLFFDYNTFKKEQIQYESVTCLWALWAEVATKEQADQMVPVALNLFEVEGGLVSGTLRSRGEIGLDKPSRQ